MFGEDTRKEKNKKPRERRRTERKRGTKDKQVKSKRDRDKRPNTDSPPNRLSATPTDLQEEQQVLPGHTEVQEAHQAQAVDGHVTNERICIQHTRQYLGGCEDA